MLALIGRKMGMTQVFTEDGTRVPVSVVQVEPNTVVRERTEDANGYRATVLGAEALKKGRVTKPYAGQFPQGIEPTRFLLEFRDYERECKVGDRLGVEVFEGVRWVDVTPVSREAATDSSLVAGDGLHPSGAMYVRWVEAALPVVAASRNGDRRRPLDPRPSHPPSPARRRRAWRGCLFGGLTLQVFFLGGFSALS